jgi:hypothetical protein
MKTQFKYVLIIIGLLVAFTYIFAQQYTKPSGKIYTYTLTPRDTPDYRKRLEKMDDPGILGIWSNIAFDSSRVSSGSVFVLLKRNDSVFLKDYYFNRFHIDDLAGTLDYWYIEKNGKRSNYSDLILNNRDKLYQFLNNDTMYRYYNKLSKERRPNPEFYPLDSVTECFRGNLAFREMVKRKDSLTIGRWDWGDMGILARLFRKGEMYYIQKYTKEVLIGTQEVVLYPHTMGVKIEWKDKKKNKNEYHILDTKKDSTLLIMDPVGDSIVSVCYNVSPWGYYWSRIDSFFIIGKEPPLDYKHKYGILNSGQDLIIK